MSVKDYCSKDLAQFLVNGELYSSQKFKNFGDNVLISFFVPQIEKFCDTCQSFKPFNSVDGTNRRNHIYNGRGFDYVIEQENKLNIFEFLCVTCQTEKYYSALYQTVTAEEVTFLKAGEFPRKLLVKDKDLIKFFDNDIELYNKAVICLAHGFGVGAFAYMRQIVENNINSLLDIVGSDDNIEDIIKTSLEALRRESPMNEKIKIANTALPNYLMLKGLNPLGAIYKALSEGVHNLSDEECLKRAKNLQSSIKFIVGGVAAHKRHVDEYKQNITLLQSM